MESILPSSKGAKILFNFFSSLQILFAGLVQDIAIVVTVAYLLAQTKIFGRIINRRLGWTEQLLLVIFFGLIGIFGTYSGIPIYGALANSRVLGPVVGGMLGGPLVGLGAGLIAGVHRFFIGGFTGLACGISTILEGLLGGLVQRYLKGPITWPVALAVGALAELMQMVIIILIARPLEQSVTLVKTIGLPMVGVNSIGIAIFFLIVRSVITGQSQIGAQMAHRVLRIANLTLPILRTGLNEQSAQNAAEIIYRLSTYSAVAITDTEKILAHVGEGADHHKPGEVFITQASRMVIASNQTMVARSQQEIGCSHNGCPLGVAILAPLRQKGEVIGILKLYRHSFQEGEPMDIEFAEGLAAIIDTQLELMQLHRQQELVAQAELRALQAQINPHFLFNALNTISTYVRTQPENARDLLHHLSDFIRRSIKEGQDMVTLADEIHNVQDYLAIEKARFGERLKVEVEIDNKLMSEVVPGLILQPLVENAVQHGLANLKNGGTVIISGVQEGGSMLITVADDGVGIPAEKLSSLLFRDTNSEAGLGIALHNVNDRLQNLYGQQYPLKIESKLNKGTRVSLHIPLTEKGGIPDDNSHHSG